MQGLNWFNHRVKLIANGEILRERNFVGVTQ